MDSNKQKAEARAKLFMKHATRNGSKNLTKAYAAMKGSRIINPKGSKK